MFRNYFHQQVLEEYFPGGPVVKNLPGPGMSLPHMQWGS